MTGARRKPGRPPGSTSDVTRAKILSAARDCFARQGFDLATNRDIAEHAGVTAAAIYQYFQSKTALYAAAADETIAEVVLHMRDYAEPGAGTAVGLSRVLMGLLELHQRDPSRARFLTALPTELQRHPELAELLKSRPNEVPVVTLALVHAGVKRGEVAPTDVEGVISMFIACLMGLSQFSVMFGQTLGEPATRAFARLLEGTLFERGRAGQRDQAQVRD